MAGRPVCCNSDSTLAAIAAIIMVLKACFSPLSEIGAVQPCVKLDVAVYPLTACLYLYLEIIECAIWYPDRCRLPLIVSSILP